MFIRSCRPVARSAVALALVASFAWSSLAAPVIGGAASKDEPLPSDQPTVDRMPPAVEKLVAGHKALAAGDLDAAEKAFAEARRLGPNLPGPLLGLAEIAKLRNRLGDIEPLIRAAIAADPYSAEANRALGRMLFAMRDGAAAEVVLRRTAELSPDDFRSHTDLGELYIQLLNRPDAAAAAFERAVALQPGHAGARYGLGVALAAMGRLDAAAASLGESSRLEPKNILPLLALGQVRIAQRDADAAIAAYERAVEIQPRFVAAQEGLGDAQSLKGAHEKALGTYRTAAQLAPTSPWPAFKQGNVLLAMKRNDEAERAFAASVAIDDRFAPGYNNLANLAAGRRERHAQALAWAQKAVELAPQGATYWDTLASVRLARGEIDAAIEAGRRATSLPPASAEHHYTLGVALQRKSSRAEAAAEFRRALELDARFPQAEDARRRLKELGG